MNSQDNKKEEADKKVVVTEQIKKKTSEMRSQPQPKKTNEEIRRELGFHLK